MLADTKQLQLPGETATFLPIDTITLQSSSHHPRLNVLLYYSFSFFLPYPPNPKQTCFESKALPGGGSPDPNDDTTGLGAEGGGGASANS